MSATFTIHLWFVGAYLLIGVAWFPPCVWWSYHTLARPKRPFWPFFWQELRRHPFTPLVMIALWPAATWETFR